MLSSRENPGNVVDYVDLFAVYMSKSKGTLHKIILSSDQGSRFSQLTIDPPPAERLIIGFKVQERVNGAFANSKHVSIVVS